MATSSVLSGWKRLKDYTGSVLGLYSAGQIRADVGNATLTTEGGASSALLLGMGNSTTRAVTGTASAKFLSFYTEGNADGIYGAYFRHYVSTAAVGNDCLRAFGTVNNVAASTVRGAHVSLSFGTSGTVSGLGAALEATLHIPNSATQAGTLYAVKAAINSDGSTSDPAGATVLAYLGAVNQGDATGGADVDDDVALIHIDGHTIGNGNLVEAVGTAYALSEFTHSIRIKVGSTLYYIPISNLAGSAT